MADIFRLGSAPNLLSPHTIAYKGKREKKEKKGKKRGWAHGCGFLGAHNRFLFAAVQDKPQRDDPTRAGEPVNPLLPSGGIATGIEKEGANATKLQRLQNRQHGGEYALERAFANIGAITERLGLNSKQKEKADELFKEIHERGLAKRKHNAVYAACVYLACRIENREHTFREICGATPGTTVKEIGKAVKRVKEHIRDTKLQPTVSQRSDPKQHVGNFLSGMGIMDKQLHHRTREMVDSFLQLRASDPSLTAQRQPATVAAACIYLALLLHDDRMSSSETRREVWDSLQRASGMKQSTIITAFREDIFPRRTQFVPSSLASPEEVERLQNPHGP